MPEEHGRQLLLGTKEEDTVTQEKVKNGVTGNHAAIVKAPLPYDKSIRDFCTTDHCSDTVRYPVSDRVTKTQRRLNTSVVHAQSQE